MFLTSGPSEFDIVVVLNDDDYNIVESYILLIFSNVWQVYATRNTA